MTKQLPISDIKDEPAFRVREPDADTVARYAEDIDRLPPVEVWSADGGAVYLVDGRHRLEAHRQCGLETIPVVFFDGSRLEAEARARAANLSHALPLTAGERRQARIEILERLYEYSNNWLAQDYMACSPNTVAALRISLEDTGQIPRVDRFKSKDGSLQPRNHARNEAPDEAEGFAPDEPEAESPEWYGDLDLAPAEDEPDETPGTSGEAPSANAKTPVTDGFGDNGEPGRDSFSPAQTQNAMVKLAQVGEPLAVEVTLYVDGEAMSIPVTMLMADGAIGGVNEAAPGFDNVLVLKQQLAQELGLWL